MNDIMPLYKISRPYAHALRVRLTCTPYAHTPYGHAHFFSDSQFFLIFSSTIDSGVHSQQSLNKSVKIEILQPEVKDLLSTCAKYNLENAKNHDSRSAEILEEIRQAEAIEKEKQQLKKADKNSDSISTYENSPLKKAKTLVAMDMNGTPVTTLLRDGSPASTRKAEKLATQQSQQTVDEIPNRIPVFMVVIILFGYITVGK